MGTKFQHAGMGGTFDRLHKGHQELINKALENAQHITIGLTVDDFSNQKTLHQIIHSYKERESQLLNYLDAIGHLSRASIIPLEDVYGPTISDKTIDCIVVTSQTLSGAEIINQKRQELNLKKLPIIKAELVTDESGNYISSTRIRQGHINRDGEIYSSILSQEVVLNDKQKNQLKNPQGNLAADIENLNNLLSKLNPTYTSLVGDITLSFFIENNLGYNLAFYDGKTKRQPNNQVETLINKSPDKLIPNYPGTINPVITSVFQENLEKSIVKVDGEEDLIAVGLVLLQPLQSVIIYGQPDSGLVIIKVDEEKKEQIKNLLSNS